MVKNQGRTLLSFYMSLEMHEAFMILHDLIGKDVQALMSYNLKSYIHQMRKDIHEKLWLPQNNEREQLIEQKERLEKDRDKLEIQMNSIDILHDDEDVLRTLSLKKKELEKGIQNLNSVINHIQTQLYEYKKTMDSFKFLFEVEQSVEQRD